MTKNDFDFVISMFEGACSTEGVGKGIGARRFFSVDAINRLVAMASDDYGFATIDSQFNMLAILADDVADLCKIILREALVGVVK